VSDAVTSVDASADVRLVLDVVRVAARLGGPPAAAIDRTGSTLRVRAADCEERAAHAAQARLSAHVLTAVPLAMLALMATLDPDVGHAVATPIGSLCILFGLGLNLAGWTWMRRIVTVTT
jgi:Flp pilus assembly protein TadB